MAAAMHFNHVITQIVVLNFLDTHDIKYTYPLQIRSSLYRSQYSSQAKEQ